MNFSLRCGQLLAERANIQRMNIIDRTAWWYRMERIGQPLPEEPKEVIYTDEQWTNRQWDEVQQLKAMVLHSQKKIDEMRANAKKKRYSII